MQNGQIPWSSVTKTIFLGKFKLAHERVLLIMHIHGTDCERCHHKLCTKKVPIFSTLGDEEIGGVSDLIVRRQYLKGELILIEGDKFDSLIILNTGKAKAFRDTADGKEQILYIFSAGDFFGEKNLLGSQTASYNVEALEETHVCMIRKSDFRQLLRANPDIGLKVMEELSGRMDRLESSIENMGTRSVEARVGAVLLEFSQKYGKTHSDGIIIELPLSREGIANYIGVARETVSRKMNYLQDEGIIEMVGNKKVIILDKKALELEIQ